MPLGLLPDGWVIFYTYNFETAPAYCTNQVGEPLIFTSYNAAVQAVESTLAGWGPVPPQYMWITQHYGMWIDGEKV